MLHEFLNDLSQCGTQEKCANLINKYIGRNVRFCIRLVCYRAPEGGTITDFFDNDDNDNDNNTQNRVELFILSKFLCAPTELNFERITAAANLTAAQLSTLRDLVFTRKFHALFNSAPVYKVFEKHNMNIEHVIHNDFDVETVENCLTACGSYEFGMPVAVPIYRPVRWVVSVADAMKKNINMNNLIEVAPIDYVVYQVHYSKVREIVVYDSEMKRVRVNDTTRAGFYNLFGNGGVLAAGAVVYHSPRTGTSLVSDVFYIHTVERDVDMRQYPLWTRMVIIRKHFGPGMTTYCTNYQHLRDKREYCLIFKDKASRFMFDVKYETVQGKHKLEVCISACITNGNFNYIYNVVSPKSRKQICTVNSMDICEKIRGYLLYNLRSTHRRKNAAGHTVSYYNDSNIRVFGYYCKKNTRFNKMSTSFRITSVSSGVVGKKKNK